MAATDIYKKLARHPDNLPGGFPPTESGVELRILKRLFTPEEAALAIHLTLIPEELRVIARRAKIDREEAGRKLEEMSKKGLIFRVALHGEQPQYTAVQFLIGIWEFHVNDLDPDLIRDMEEYISVLFDYDVWKKAPHLRTIPVGGVSPPSWKSCLMKERKNWYGIKRRPWSHHVSADGNAGWWARDVTDRRSPVSSSEWARTTICTTVSPGLLSSRRFWIFSEKRTKPVWCCNPGTVRKL